MCAVSPDRVTTNLTEVEFSRVSIIFQQNGTEQQRLIGALSHRVDRAGQKASLHTLAPARGSGIRPEIGIWKTTLLHLVA
jgi:hypothetical protein